MIASHAKILKMLDQGAPHLIRNDAQLEAYTTELFALTSVPVPSPQQQEAIDLLSLLIETYERGRYPVPAASSVEVLQFLMEANGLRQRDLTELGSEGNVSLILNGKRSLTVRHIRALADRFHVSPAVFLSGEQEPRAARRAA